MQKTSQQNKRRPVFDKIQNQFQKDRLLWRSDTPIRIEVDIKWSLMTVIEGNYTVRTGEMINQVQ
jgi:hypothetical protein